MNIRRKRILLIGVPLLLVVVAALILIFGRSDNVPVEEDHSHVDALVIDNTDSLSSILLADQYAAVYQVLVNYISDNISSPGGHAVIVDKPVVSPNGTITFFVKVDKPQKQFKVEVDRLTFFDKLILKIPEENYEKIIEIY